MIRIGSLSEKHDRRAQKEGFANKEGDSDAEYFDMCKHSTQIGDFLKSHQSMWKNIEIIFGHSKSHQST